MTFATDADYRAHSATSYTRHIKPMVTASAAHSKWRDEHPSKDTSSRAFLSAVHCLALEPQTFDAQYWVMPEGMDRGDITRTTEAMCIDLSTFGPIIEDDATGRDALAGLIRNGANIIVDDTSRRAKWKEAAEALPAGTYTAKTKTYEAAYALRQQMDVVDSIDGRAILSVSEHERAVRIADTLRTHKMFAAALFHPEARVEHAYRWDDPIVGEGKGKADLLIPGLLTLDLKTYRSDDPRKAGQDITSNAWDVQAAWYERGYEFATGTDMSSAARITVVAVEGTGDYEGMVTVGWFEHSDAMRAVGDARLERALHRLAECRESGVWPSACPEDGAVIDPPRWAVLDAGLDPDEVYAPNITITPLPDND